MNRRFLVPLVVLVTALVGAFLLVRSRPQVEAVAADPLAPLVRVSTVEAREMHLDVHAQGTVIPRTETHLVAQVAGTITWVAPSFEIGSFFRRGEVLAKLDPRDYEVAVKRAVAALSQAEVRLVREQAEAEVAAEEWRQLGEGDPSPLVLRQPQVAEAQAGLDASRAELEKTRLDLERTRIRAPFDGRVQNKLAGLGEFLTPGRQIASVHAIDYAEVRLPVPDHSLAYLDLAFAGGTTSAEVVLSAEFAGERHRWSGNILRTEGALDNRSRMINLVARVEDPYGRRQGAVGRAPLVVGLFVEAEIAGRRVDHAVTLPRRALRSIVEREGEVWVVDEDDRLRPRRVQVLRLEGETATLSGGLENGERVCISTLEVAVDGMRVRTLEADSEPQITGPAGERS